MSAARGTASVLTDIGRRVLASGFLSVSGIPRWRWALNSC